MTGDTFEKAILGDNTKYSVKAKYFPNMKAKFPFCQEVAHDSNMLDWFREHLSHPNRQRRGA